VIQLDHQQRSLASKDDAAAAQAKVYGVNNAAGRWRVRAQVQDTNESTVAKGTRLRKATLCFLSLIFFLITVSFNSCCTLGMLCNMHYSSLQTCIAV
jgi:hypothetical protein